MLTRAFGDGVFKRRDMSMAPFINYLPYITSEPEINILNYTCNRVILVFRPLFWHIIARNLKNLNEKFV